MEELQQNVLTLLESFAATWGFKLIGAIVLGGLGITFAGWAGNAMLQLSVRSTRVDKTLLPLLAKLVKWSIITVTSIAVLDLFGIQTASILAFLGAAGIAVALALKDTVADVAAGVMLLILRPFDVGDGVDIGGTTGTVEVVGLFETKLRTFDGIPLVITNSKIRGKEIRNFARARMRRFDLRLRLSYADDIGAALEAIRQLVEAESRIFTDPAPVLAVETLGESAVNLLVRGWTVPPEFFKTQWDLSRAIKERFDELGISIPAPQYDVRLRELKGA